MRGGNWEAIAPRGESTSTTPASSGLFTYGRSLLLLFPISFTYLSTVRGEILNLRATCSYAFFVSLFFETALNALNTFSAVSMSIGRCSCENLLPPDMRPAGPPDTLWGTLSGTSIGSGVLSGCLRGTRSGTLSGSLWGTRSGTLSGSFSGTVSGTLSGSFSGTITGLAGFTSGLTGCTSGISSGIVTGSGTEGISASPGLLVRFRFLGTLKSLPGVGSITPRPLFIVGSPSST